MQLTNICRDVLEDWQRGRLYLPQDLLAAHGAGGLRAALGDAFPDACSEAVASSVDEMLQRAAGYYASGDRGLCYLPLRCRLSIGTARLVYADIGEQLRRRGCDPRVGRVFVPRLRKLWLALRALGRALWRQQGTAAAVLAVALVGGLGSPVGVLAQSERGTGTGTGTGEKKTGTLTVQLVGFDNDRGQALVSLFRGKQGFPGKVANAIWSKALRISARKVQVTIRNVPAGMLALAMVHDEDSDFALDTGLFGIPTEGYGASRDAPANFGPPEWADAAFSLRAGEHKQIRVRVRY
jgi:uncharacterized protein (DUF2141 family)